MFDLSGVGYSRTDIKDKRIVPKFMSEELAELVGCHVGDGCINKNKSSIEITYSGSHEDLNHHTEFIKKAFKNLFNYDAKIIFPTEREVSTKVYSKAASSFFINVIGLVIGHKSKMQGIPKVIMNSNKEIKCAFLRGLADTDFSLCFKKNDHGVYREPWIGTQLSNRNIISDASLILDQINISNCMLLDLQNFDKRVNKTRVSHYIQICGSRNLEKWMNFIGFHNMKHLSKYLLYVKKGYCNPKTTLDYRLKELGLRRKSLSHVLN